jgi:hypothetical protein
MTELVLAMFDAASAANMAIQDLEVARIPSAVIQRGVRNDSSASARPLVIVAVDEMHAPAITGILNQYCPLEIEERAAPKATGVEAQLIASLGAARPDDRRRDRRAAVTVPAG